MLFILQHYDVKKNAEKYKKHINGKVQNSLIKYTKESNSLGIKQLVTIFFG